ncbi:type II secretion system protein [bacterium AH-315-P07]|nr:type II secretion system protein [bacterium AH-315-P07]
MKMNRIQSLRTNRGFSLLELLLAVSMMGVVTTVGITSFAKLTATWKNTQVLLALEDTADVAFRNIEQDLADTLSAELSGVSIVGINRDVASTIGVNQAPDADDRLIIPTQGSLYNTNLFRTRFVQYQIQRDEERALLRRITRDFDDPTRVLTRLDIIPEADVIRFDVTFATGDADTPWVDEWESAEMPRAVRVCMTLTEPGNLSRQISRKETYAVHVR